MTRPTPTQAIGIFDSGIGGLTVAQALVKQLPTENIIYFGDTAHLPYGDKSATTIQSYSIKIADMLLKQPCKLILIACNSASAAAYEPVKQFVGEKAHVLDVINPLVNHLRDHYPRKNIGLIATRQTVNSNVYQQKIAALNLGIHLTSHATNLLASAIEEFGNHNVIDSLLKEYLNHDRFNHIEALVLACTHYPVIKDRIADFFKHTIEIIDSSDIVATAVKQHLTTEKLLNPQGKGNKSFFVSDYTDSFAAGTKLFFNEEIKLQHYSLGE
jgi:glutamate racemase